jgi:hypothetical protein
VYGLCVCETVSSNGLFRFNATFNNISVISWRSVLFVEETVVPRENHQAVASHLHTLSHNVVSSTSRHERGSNSSVAIFTDLRQTVPSSNISDIYLIILNLTFSVPFSYIYIYNMFKK